MTSKEALKIIDKDLLVLEILKKYVHFDKGFQGGLTI